ncbi:sensor histidine kinase [uncultured Acetobacteroides sp.]|uniref:sensor histidine kinase n=1 Tax=uncultured Acetobacteroides sp. TaxID=1760811 RepID=UPI0029F5B200|nr:sensor histidine kinase [uncultured Acetobacteroides sp.]
MSNKKTLATIKDGVCSLKGEMEPGKFYGMNGNVEFYWNRLISPNEFKISAPQKDGYLKIPGLWNGKEVNGKKIGGQGCATLRFWLNLDRNKSYGLKIRELDCSYRIFIDGMLKAECGKVGKSEEHTEPSWHRRELYFYTCNSLTEVVIQISNFQHWKGGPEDTMILGQATDVVDLKQKVVGSNFFILGVFLVMALYHLVLYLYRRKDKSSLVFSIMCCIITIRLLTTGEKLIFLFFPQLDWLVAVKFEYFSYILAGPVFLHFIEQIYPTLTSSKILKVCYGVAAFFVAIVLILPSTYFTYTPIAYQFILLVEGGYVFYILLMAIYCRYSNSLVLLLGYCFLFAVMMNDILFYNGMVDTSFLMPLGLFVMVFSQAFVLSKKASVAFYDVEILSRKLQQYNKELEDVVEERTQSISFQKQEIESKAEELKRVNEKLVKVDRLKNALTAMIVHDLKNPLNMVLNYSNDAKITSAGQQMLSLVQNILDIQKYENDKMMLNRHNILIGTVVEKSLSSVSYFAAQHGISLVNKIAANIELDIDADVVERIFTNLLTNALKYTPMNSEVVLSCAIDDGNIRFFITDKGPGIPMDKGELIFEKYGSYNEQMLGRVKPTGLGLTFCKMAVEAHGGTIGFESEMGKGTQMWFTLPLSSNQKLEELEPNISEESVPNVSYELPTFQSDEEKVAFQKVISSLLEIEVYKASRIRKVLSNEMPKGNPSIMEWIDTLLSSVWTGNEQRYTQQLKATAQLLH